MLGKQALWEEDHHGMLHQKKDRIPTGVKTQ
jgi:hypothetical protein